MANPQTKITKMGKQKKNVTKTIKNEKLIFSKLKSYKTQHQLIFFKVISPTNFMILKMT